MQVYDTVYNSLRRSLKGHFHGASMCIVGTGASRSIDCVRTIQIITSLAKSRDAMVTIIASRNVEESIFKEKDEENNDEERYIQA